MVNISLGTRVIRQNDRGDEGTPVCPGLLQTLTHTRSTISKYMLVTTPAVCSGAAGDKVPPGE